MPEFKSDGTLFRHHTGLFAMNGSNVMLVSNVIGAERTLLEAEYKNIRTISGAFTIDELSRALPYKIERAGLEYSLVVVKNDDGWDAYYATGASEEDVIKSGVGRLLYGCDFMRRDLMDSLSSLLSKVLQYGHLNEKECTEKMIEFK